MVQDRNRVAGRSGVMVNVEVGECGRRRVCVGVRVGGHLFVGVGA